MIRTKTKIVPGKTVEIRTKIRASKKGWRKKKLVKIQTKKSVWPKVFLRKVSTRINLMYFHRALFSWRFF